MLTDDGRAGEKVKLLRIYVGGLILHVQMSRQPKERAKGSAFFLDSSDKLIVPSVTYEASYQYENMLHLMRESHSSRIERK